MEDNNNHKLPGYYESVEANEKIVDLAEKFITSQDYAVLLEMFEWLLPTTRQIIERVIEKSGYNRAVFDDMVQESYLRLESACWYFEPETCPVFITFWRTTLDRHLVSHFKKEWRHSALSDSYDAEDRNYGILTKSERIVRFLIRIETKYSQEFDSWDDRSSAALAIRILRDRICTKRVLQSEIAKDFSLSPCQISNWETWIRKKIAAEMKPDFLDLEE